MTTTSIKVTRECRDAIRAAADQQRHSMLDFLHLYFVTTDSIPSVATVATPPKKTAADVIREFKELQAEIDEPD